METAIETTKQGGALAGFTVMMDTDKASARDILVPKILFMQLVSGLVKKEKAKIGELRSSLDGNLLADKGQGIEFIAFNKNKTRVTFKKEILLDPKTKVRVGYGAQEYVSTVPWTHEFEGKERTEVIDGEEFEHFETLNYYVLLTSDIAKHEAFPYLISFRSTAYKTGKALETFRTKLQMAGKPLPFKVFTLGLEQQENEKGMFFVPTVTMGRDSTEEELNTVKQWHDLIATSNVTVDDSDLAVEETHGGAKVDTTAMNTDF